MSNIKLFVSLFTLSMFLIFSLLPLFEHQCFAQDEMKPELNCSIVNPDIGTPEVVRTAFRPLFQYLMSKIGIKINVFIIPDVETTVSRLKENSIDFGYTGIVDYFRIEEQFPIKPALTFVKWGKNNYAACFAVRKNDTRKELKDFKGSPMGFTSFHKTFGGIYPQILLHEKGFPPELETFFSSVKPYYADIAAVQDLLASKIDVCIVTQSSINIFTTTTPWLIENMKILYQQDNLMFAPIFYRSDMDPEMREALIKHTLDFFSTPKGKQFMMMFRVDGVQRVTAEEYAPDRNRAMQLGYIKTKK